MTAPCTGIVLAGGRGARMGAFKPALVHDGLPLVARAMDALAPWCEEVLVMAGERADALPRIPGARVLPDPGQGPHSAVALAAREARHATLLLAPADAPFLTPSTYEPLVAVGPSACFVVGGIDNPLFGIYARDPLLAALVGARSMRDAAARVGAARIEAGPRARELADIDTPADLARLRQGAL